VNKSTAFTVGVGFIRPVFIAGPMPACACLPVRVRTQTGRTQTGIEPPFSRGQAPPTEKENSYTIYLTD